MIRNKDHYLTVAEIAKKFGMTRDHIRHRIYEGKIKATKWGNIWLVKVKDLKNFKRQRFPRI